MIKIRTNFQEPAIQTMPALLDAAVKSHADRIFLVSADARYSFADAQHISGEMACGLIAVGVGKGAHVGIMLPNCPEWVLAFLAVTRIGAVAVTMSTLYQPGELAYALAHQDVDTLVTCASYLGHDYLDRLERALPGLSSATSTDLCLPSHPWLRRIIVSGTCDRSWANSAQNIFAPDGPGGALKPDMLAKAEASIHESDVLLTISTSGSTALPKSVVHAHGGALRTSRNHLERIDLTADDRVAPLLALFWIGGLLHILQALRLGYSLNYPLSTRPADVFELIEQEAITVLAMWPTQHAALLRYADEHGLDAPSVRRGLFPPRNPDGTPVRQPVFGNYLGMSESFGMHSMELDWSCLTAEKKGTSGRTLRDVERRIVDPGDGHEVEAGAIGELQIRGPNLMVGYYGRSRHETFTEDGFFPTGDLVNEDADGFIYFRGRLSETIKSSGANVSPPEVENAIRKLGGVVEAIVFGMEDEAQGERVVAVVVPAAGATIEPAAMIAALKPELSSYKLPSRIHVLAYDEIPRTATMKPVKRDLAAIIQRLERASIVAEA